MANTLEQIESVIIYRKDAVELKKWAFEQVMLLHNGVNNQLELNLTESDKLIEWILRSKQYSDDISQQYIGGQCWLND